MTFISTPYDSPMIRIGVLQTGRAPEPLRGTHGDYGEMCRDLVGGAPATSPIYAVLDEQFPDDPEECGAWIVTGSRFGVHDDFEWIDKLRSFLRGAYAARRKIVGICFGHQLLAEALGGEVRKHPDGPGIGVTTYDFTDTADGPATIALPAWHYDQVHVPPVEARVIARSAFCAYAGLAYGDQAISFQAHPEFSTAYLADLLAFYQKRGLPGLQAADGLRSLATPTGSALIADRLRAFLSV